MKIYKITFNEYSWDEYIAFVVVAKSEEEAIEYLKKEYPDGGCSQIQWKPGYKIEEIKSENYKEPTEILGSYNAG